MVFSAKCAVMRFNSDDNLGLITILLSVVVHIAQLSKLRKLSIKGHETSKIL